MEEVTTDTIRKLAKQLKDASKPMEDIVLIEIVGVAKNLEYIALKDSSGKIRYYKEFELMKEQQHSLN